MQRLLLLVMTVIRMLLLLPILRLIVAETGLSARRPIEIGSGVDSVRRLLARLVVVVLVMI